MDLILLTNILQLLAYIFLVLTAVAHIHQLDKTRRERKLSTFELVTYGIALVALVMLAFSIILVRFI